MSKSKKDYDRKRHLQQKYGINEEWYKILLSYQANGCAICQCKNPRTRFGGFHIDHDHRKQNIRGLLCGPCNMGLGAFQDNPFLLKMAWAYLTLSQEVTNGIRTPSYTAR